MIALLLAAAVLVAPSPPAASAAEPAASTATARAPRPTRPTENPWALSYGLDRRGDRYGRVDYRLRWSLRDFAGAESGGTRGSGSPLEDTVRGLFQGMGVEVYGVRLRPFRDLPLTAPLPAVEASVSTSAVPSPAAAPRAARRRPVYSWDRLYEDLESSARRETERFIVREGFDRSLPAHRSATHDQKKALGSGLLDLGRGAYEELPWSRP